MSDLPEWLQTEFIRAIFDLAAACGGEARVVGGAVRNWQAGKMGNKLGSQNRPHLDIDLAVNLDIETFGRAAVKSGFSVYPTGLRYGSITLGYGQERIEITQLRIDQETDGRHAKIALTQSWDEDARRRDFTINALYLSSTGQLFDPVGGLADLNNRKLRFIGNAKKRIAEDHLRLLRALRFLAQYPDLSMDADDLGCVEEAGALLNILSAERIAGELRRLFAGANALPVIHMMHRMGIDNILFSSAFLSSALGQVWPSDIWAELGFCGQLALLLAPGGRKAAGLRLKLSRKEIAFLSATDILEADLISQLASPDWQQAAYHLGPLAGFAYCVFMLETGTPLNVRHFKNIIQFESPICPISGRDIIEHYQLSGRAVGLKLAKLQSLWVDSGFKLRREELLSSRKM